MVKKISSIINKEITSLHGAAYLLGFFALLSQLLALVRDKLLAHYFGAGETLDVYYAAFRIPDMLFVTLGSVVSASILMPFLINKFKSSEEDGKRFINTVFSSFLLSIIFGSCLAFILMPFLIYKFIPGFNNTSSFDSLVLLSRIILLSPIFLGISNFLSSITQMHKRFLIYALSPIAYNIGLIFGTLFLFPVFGLMGLGFGVALGAIMHMVIQLPFIFGKRILPKFTFFLDLPMLKNLLIVSIPRIITLSLSQVTSLFLISLASIIGVGSIAVFNLAFNLQSVPLSIIGVSYTSAVFPVLSKFYVENNSEEFVLKMAESIKHILFWSIPATVLFIMLRAQIVRTIYGSGLFDWSDTRLTAAVLALFVVSVSAQSLILLFIRGYYAMGKTKEPLIINVISAIFTISASFLMYKLFMNYSYLAYFFEDILKVTDQKGTAVLMLPFAYSIGAVLNVLLLWYKFGKFAPGFSNRINKSIFQVFSSSIIMGYVIFLSLRLFDSFFSLTKLTGVFMQGFLSGILGIIAFIVILILLGNNEIISIWKTIHQKVWSSKIRIPEQRTL